jgi:hypothetical protein
MTSLSPSDQFIAAVAQVTTNYLNAVANINTNSPALNADVVATTVASFHDLADTLATTISEFHPTTTLDPVAVGRMLSRANAAVAAVLEIPEIAHAYNNGGDVSEQIAGAAGASSSC